MTPFGTSPAWGTGRLVVFAGAGISAVPPSDLPSWWHFNEAVLDGVRASAKGGFDLPLDGVRELDELTVDDIGVTKFSEVVTDGFAGSSWFDLLSHLDGSLPSPCHDALAQLAERGLLAAIVTTNFDTLIERAFADRGIPLDVYIPFDGASPAADLGDVGSCLLVKVHGSVTEKSSLIDLARQKARGLPPLLRAWLSRTLAEHPVLVVGFSGADLELGEDYFGFRAGFPRTPWMRWISRPGRAPLQVATSAVAMAPNGSFLEGELPQALEDVGIHLPAARERKGGPVPRPREWVDDWLAEPGASPEASAALSARLLRLSGRPTAVSICDSVRSQIDEKLKARVTFIGALSSALALAQIGNDLVGIDPEQALADLNRSRAIIDALLTEEVREKLSEDSRIEMSTNTAGVLFNVALTLISLSKLEEAEKTLAEIPPIVDAIPPDQSLRQYARAWFASGVISRTRGQNREALLSWRRACLMAESSGVLNLALSCAENMWRALVDLGEVDLARLSLDQASRLRTLVPTPPSSDEGIELPWGEADRRAVFPTLIDRLETEVRLGGGRLDEVLYSAWAATEGADDLRDQLRLALAKITPAELEKMEDRQRALASIARHALEADDQIALLNPTPLALNEWFWKNLGASRSRTLPEAKLLMMPELRDAAITAGKRWAQTGVLRQREEKWVEAEVQFLVGGCAFALAEDHDEATRAFLYAVDSMARRERYDEAEAMLEWLAQGSGPKNTSDVLSRRINLLTYRVAAEELEADIALERARPWLVRLEQLDDNDSIGASLVALGSLHLHADEKDEAARQFQRAETLLSKPEHKKMALTGLRQAQLDEVG